MGGVAYLTLALKMCLSLIAIHCQKQKVQAPFHNFSRWQHFTNMTFGEMCHSLVVWSPSCRSKVRPIIYLFGKDPNIFERITVVLRSTHPYLLQEKLQLRRRKNDFAAVCLSATALRLTLCLSVFLLFRRPYNNATPQDPSTLITSIQVQCNAN